MQTWVSLSKASTGRDNESCAGSWSPMYQCWISNGNHVEGLMRCWILFVVVFDE